MVSIEYIKGIMSAFNITQKQLTKEWSALRKDGKKKHQSNLSLVMEKEYTDSITMIKALSYLTGVPTSDIIEEVSWNKDKNAIVYNMVNDPMEAYGDNNKIPVIRDSQKIGQAMLPKEWLKEGVNKISQANVSGMNFNERDFFGSVMLKNTDWPNVSPKKVYEVVTKKGSSMLRRIRRSIAEDGVFTFVSDQVNTHPSMNVKAEDIKEIWEVIFRVSWEFPKPNDENSIHNEIEDLRSVVERMYYDIKALKAS